MKLSQILKIAGAVVAIAAGLALVFKVLGELGKHPVLIAFVLAGGLAYYVGNFLKKRSK